MKIGVFDSGLGGLIILKEIIKKLPHYNYVYLGDNARTPYGNRSQEVIYKFTEQAVDFLFKKDCQLVIIACNTASAEALRIIQQKWLPEHYPERKVLGVIRPVVEKAVVTAKHKVGVIGTKGTINSQAYIKEIANLKPNLEVIQQATPLLVPIIEEGWYKTDINKKVLRKYLRPLKLVKVDTLILGCTHYPILFKEIQGIMGKRTKVLNSGKIVADSLADYLKRHNEIEEKLVQEKINFKNTQDLRSKESLIVGRQREKFNFSAYKNLELYTTDDSAHYQELVQHWFKQRINFNKVNLE